ncbi:MAG: Coenzyme F420 hydrogenase/dehydrogenase, beta subunit C-terminal domain [Sedimentisphaerales bacterium]|nr:Coenzyme F420 hydrogenase/dehydrogenase, beta subunit C-terminal domain [Sedimentisphaerales bacterium]
MSHSFGSVAEAVSWRLCLGCGACVSVCPNRALILVDVANDGLRPKTDHNRCAQCGECIKVCPGVNIEIAGTEAAALPELRRAWGPVLEIWEGYAADPEIRFLGSSGGLVTALSLYCIEKARMQGVLHAGADAGNPLANVPVISRDRQALLGRTGSRYAPAAPCAGFGLLNGEAGSQFVFAGKPCDVAAVRKWQALEGTAGGKVAVAISIFCAGTPSTQGTLRIIEQLGVEPGQVRELRYRGCGWPGRTVVKTGGGLHEPPSMSYAEAWGEILSKHTQFRCRLCPDSTGESADLSCGDPWYRQIEPDDPGRSLVLVRTEVGRRILHEAMAAGYVQLERVDAGVLPRSQQSLLRRRQELWGRLAALRLLRVPVPRFGGFSLLANWMALPVAGKTRSILGTVRRALQRGWNRPNRSDAG